MAAREASGVSRRPQAVSATRPELGAQTPEPGAWSPGPARSQQRASSVWCRARRLDRPFQGTSGGALRHDRKLAVDLGERLVQSSLFEVNGRKREVQPGQRGT